MAEKPVRLRFTEDDLADNKVAKAASKAEKAADKADKAVSRLPTKRRLRREPATAGSKKSKLRRESTAAAKSKEKLRFGKLKIEEVEAPKPKTRGKHAAAKAPLDTVSGTAHREISRYEDDNVGLQAAHQSEEAVEGAAHVTEQAVYSSKLRKYEKAEKLVRESDNANVEALYQKYLKENPEATTNPLSRWMQKQKIKKEYAAARAAAQTGKATTSAAGTAKTVESAREKGESVLATIKGFFTNNSSGVKVALLALMDEEDAAEYEASISGTDTDTEDNTDETGASAVTDEEAEASETEGTEVTEDDNENGSMNALPVIMVVVVLAAVGGFFAYTKVKGKKKEETKPDPDADYTDEDDGEDYDLPDAYDDSDYSDEDDTIFEDDEPV